ncbi:MAG TPA: hypothetical protein VF285_13930 [Castellaniella sp.]|uniref:hypothetical protein n=1 Tax=Castellaniella sp. TaxID=1955812 RepID=UPI002F2195FE
MHPWIMAEAFLVQVRGSQLQRGQSVVEALLALAVLGSLSLAIAWLGRLQDVALQAQHASRRIAFAQSHQGLGPARLASGVDGYLETPGHAWRDRQGHALLVENDQPGAKHAVRLWNTEAVPSVQVGDPVVGANRWRHELQLGEEGVWRADVSLRTQAADVSARTLRDFDRLGLSLHRHTAILQGSGAAASDIQAQDRLSASPQAWDKLAAGSRKQGQTVQRQMHQVDSAWGRSQPEWDWTSRWADEVPAWYLKPWRQP